MLPDRVSNPGPLTYESGALPIALRGPAPFNQILTIKCFINAKPEVVKQLHAVFFLLTAEGAMVHRYHTVFLPGMLLCKSWMGANVTKEGCLQ